MTICMKYGGRIGDIHIPLSLIDIRDAYWPKRRREAETATARAQREDRIRVRRGRVVKARMALSIAEETAVDDLDAATAKAARSIAKANREAHDLRLRAGATSNNTIASCLHDQASDLINEAEEIADELISLTNATHKKRIRDARSILAQAEADLSEYEPSGEQIIEDLDAARAHARQQLFIRAASAEEVAQALDRYDGAMYDHDGKLGFHTDLGWVKLDMPTPPWTPPSQSVDVTYLTLIDRLAWVTVAWLKAYGKDCSHLLP